MKLDLLEVNKFIEETGSEEVTNPIYFNLGNTPTDDGLFSNIIFGYPGSKERKTKFGYIKLKRKFMHPVMFKLFTSMDKKILDAINAKKYFKIVNGELVEDDNGQTGVTFLYNNYDKLKFKDTGTSRRTNYLKLLSKLTRDDIFIDKFPVLPAFYRDFKPSTNANDKVDAVDEVNDHYAKLIRFSQSISEGQEYDFMGAVTEASMQNLLFTVYSYFTDMLAGKNGLFHKDMLGKSVDYATRSVISAPQINTNKWDENPIKFGYTGIPISQVVVLFYPFFLKFIQDYLLERDHDLKSFVDEETGKRVEVSNLNEQFTEDYIKKMVSLYIKSPASRFDSLKVLADDGKYYTVPLHKRELGRKFTITDLLYIAAVDIISDKHVFVTRYPIEQYRAKRSLISA